jgi:triacylglycerol esterase/lipase EstA (alpha/beta hydrolase family)
MSRSPVRRVLVAALAAVGLAAGAASSAAAVTGPPNESFVAAFAVSQVAPDLDPIGANVASCRPSAAHPRPVVLVHGTFENRYDNWASLSPRLRLAGYCVFALDYGVDRTSVLGAPPGVKGTGDIRASSGELAAFVDRVLASTGATKVDLVGHSQGGLLARQYLKYDGGATKVARVVTLGSTHHGTTLNGIGTLGREFEAFGALDGAQLVTGPAAIQQVAGSEFLTTLNAGGDTLPGIAYTAIATKYDEVTTPYETTFLTAGPGATVRNITLQDGCPIDGDDHLSMPYSPRAQAYVLRALGSDVPVPCLPRAPLL